MATLFEVECRALKAQRYRVENLYEGPMDDEASQQEPMSALFVVSPL